MTKITKADWIIIRLLYMMSVSDPTVWKFRDPTKSRYYIENKYGEEKLAEAFCLLTKEHGSLETFINAKDTKIGRTLLDSIDINYGPTLKRDVTDYTNWRFNE